MMRAVCYYRYSSDNKSQVDNSELRQESTVKDLIARNGWREVKSVTDHAVSGSKDKPNLIALQKEVESGKVKFDVLVIDDLSRLARRGLLSMYKDVAWLIDKDIQLSVCTINNGIPFNIEDLEEDFNLIFKGKENAEYLKKLSYNVRTGMLRRWNDGVLGWIGKAPYGYDIKKNIDSHSTLIPNDDLPIIRSLFKLFLREKNVRACVSKLNETKQFRDNPDKFPNSTTVKNVLRNSIYAGIRTFGVRGVGDTTISGHRKKWVGENPLVQCYDYQEYKEDGFKAAITLSDYKKVQDILDQNQKQFRKRPSRHKHTYSGLLRCGHCGGSMSASTHRSKGKKIISYCCPNSQTSRTEKCKEEETPHSKRVSTEEFEELLVSEFGKFFMDGNNHARYIDILVERLQDESRLGEENLDADIEIQQRRLDELASLYASMSDGAGAAALYKSIQQQAAKIEELKSKIDGSASNELLDFARQQFMNSKGNEGRQRYLGLCYAAASDLIRNEYTDKEYEKEKLNWGRKIRNIILHQPKFEIDEVNKTVKVVEKADNDVFFESVLKGSQKQQAKLVLEILRDMNLSHFTLHFELGLRRGKPSRVPVELYFNFLVAYTSSIGIYSVGIGDEIFHKTPQKQA